MSRRVAAGMAEIRKAHEALAATKRFRAPPDEAWLLPLHSSVSAAQQRAVFEVRPASWDFTVFQGLPVV